MRSLRHLFRRKRRIVTITLSVEDIARLTNPNQNPGESRQDWKDRNFMRHYGAGPEFFTNEEKEDDK